MQSVLDECPAFSKIVINDIKHSKHVFLAGIGLGEISAKEGALKMKELTYLHC